MAVSPVRKEMLALDNEHVKGLTEPNQYQEFNEEYFIQVSRARDSIFTEICNEFGNGRDHRFVANRYFKSSRTITKEKLGGWVETVSHILDQYCIPWLQKAAPLAKEVRSLRSEVQSLKSENTSYQKRIIDLQNQLIVKQEEQLNSVKQTVESEMKTYSAEVKATVESEMKSYSAVVSRSCSTALAPKKLQTAVKKFTEEEERSKNVVIYGLEEKKDEQLTHRVQEILTDIGEKPVIKDCFRIGVIKDKSTRPVKFSLSNHAHVTQVLKNARKLHDQEGYRSVYICPDRSPEERRAHKELVEEVKRRRESETDKVHFIRHNKVVSHSKDSMPHQTGAGVE